MSAGGPGIRSPNEPNYAVQTVNRRLTDYRQPPIRIDNTIDRYEYLRFTPDGNSASYLMDGVSRMNFRVSERSSLIDPANSYFEFGLTFVSEAVAKPFEPAPSGGLPACFQDVIVKVNNFMLQNMQNKAHIARRLRLITESTLDKYQQDRATGTYMRDLYKAEHQTVPFSCVDKTLEDNHIDGTTTVKADVNEIARVATMFVNIRENSNADGNKYSTARYRVPMSDLVNFLDRGKKPTIGVDWNVELVTAVANAVWTPAQLDWRTNAGGNPPVTATLTSVAITFPEWYIPRITLSNLAKKRFLESVMETKVLRVPAYDYFVDQDVLPALNNPSTGVAHTFTFQVPSYRPAFLIVACQEIAADPATAYFLDKMLFTSAGITEINVRVNGYFIRQTPFFFDARNRKWGEVYYAAQEYLAYRKGSTAGPKITLQNFPFYTAFVFDLGKLPLDYFAPRTNANTFSIEVKRTTPGANLAANNMYCMAVRDRVVDMDLRNGNQTAFSDAVAQP